MKRWGQYMGRDFDGPLSRFLPRRRRARRTVMCRVYDEQLDTLHDLVIRLDEQREPPTVTKVARQARWVARKTLDLNTRLRAERMLDPNRLLRDEIWVREARRLAERALEGGGDDGPASVREPRRPRPDPGDLAAEAKPPD